MTKESSQITLKGAFEGIELTISNDGRLAIDTSSQFYGSIKLTTDRGEKWRHFESTLAVNPDPKNALINAGLVQLNKISYYLCHLPDNAKANLLIAPKDTHELLKRSPQALFEDTNGNAEINPNDDGVFHRH